MSFFGLVLADAMLRQFFGGVFVITMIRIVRDLREGAKKNV